MSLSPQLGLERGWQVYSPAVGAQQIVSPVQVLSRQ
jgi:hypothetical protein